MAKKKTPIDVSRLCQSMDRYRLALRYVRDNRKIIVRETTGDVYAENGPGRETKVNLLAQYERVFARGLVGSNPRAMLSTHEPSYKPVVSKLQAYLNICATKQGIEGVFKRATIDALNLVGIVFVGLASPEDSDRIGGQVDAGEPYARVIDFDDFAYDMGAGDWTECDWIAHRYLVHKDVAVEMYGKRVKDISPTDNRDFNKEGDERIGRLSRGFYGLDDFEERIELWSVYLPRHRKILTLSEDAVVGNSKDIQEPLWEQDWIGPKRGPYHFLGFNIVSGSALPKGPKMDLLPLHNDTNNAYRKLNRMVRRLKEVTTYRRNQQSDMDELMKAEDGSMVPLDQPDSVKALVIGGNAIQTMVAVGMEYRKLFDQMGGNLSLLGGLQAQSSTAHQDEMLNQNAGASVADMQIQVVQFTSTIYESLAWWHHHHPTKVQRTPYELPGGAGTIMRTLTPEQRATVPWEEIGVQVDPYSLQHQTPNGKFQTIVQFLTTVYAPMAQMAMAAGNTLDVNKLFALAADYLNQPDLAELLQTIQPPEQAGGGGDGGGDANPPTREYVRQSQPQERDGDSDTQMRMLGHDMGGSPGGSE